jgi:hypothetical protein
MYPLDASLLFLLDVVDVVAWVSNPLVDVCYCSNHGGSYVVDNKS